MPGVTTSIGAFWVYVLESVKDGQRYIGFTTNLKERIRTHLQGKSFSTKSRLPMKLIYAEVCTNEEDAHRREEYLKTTRGRRLSPNVLNHTTN